MITPFTNGSSNWLFRGATLTDHQTIALTEKATCSRRSVWNTIPTFETSWKIELKYTTHSSTRFMADGIALWYLPPNVQHTYESSQTTYGGPAGEFTGLLIAIDNYQNTKKPKNLDRNFEQSAIIAVFNETPKKYDFETEGYDIMSGRCLVRNRYFGRIDTISTLTLEYDSNVLSIFHTNYTGDFQFCLRINNLTLPLGYNFGISAATGGFYSIFELITLNMHAKTDHIKYAFQIPQKQNKKINNSFTDQSRKTTNRNDNAKENYQDQQIFINTDYLEEWNLNQKEVTIVDFPEEIFTFVNDDYSEERNQDRKTTKRDDNSKDKSQDQKTVISDDYSEEKNQDQKTTKRDDNLKDNDQNQKKIINDDYSKEQNHDQKTIKLDDSFIIFYAVREIIILLIFLIIIIFLILRIRTAKISKRTQIRPSQTETSVIYEPSSSAGSRVRFSTA